ncbi:MAG: sodium:solute symporter [Verrucomicrobia bacterium]|nr:sodium:solute symporter [Verrucomicrobiota bacterium]
MNKISPMLAVGQVHSMLTGLDWVVIALYFGVLFCVAWWAIRKNKDTAADYFLGGRNLGWWVIGASIFASNIGSEHIVGLAGPGAKAGVALAHYELHAWCLLVLAWVFVPLYARSLVFTMPEFLEKRFCTKSRYMLSIVSIVTFIVSKIAVGIFAGGVVFGTLLPELKITVGSLVIDSFWIGSISVIILTGLYTTIGGMRAVVYNDAVQVVVLIGGSAMLTGYGLIKLGGWGELRSLCGSDMFNLWKPMVPPGVISSWSPVWEKTASGETIRQAWYFNQNFPWLGMAICAPVIGLWYWCTDQYIVQRALGAPNQTVARQGRIFAAFLKLFPVYLLICYALVKSNKVPALTAAFAADPNAAQGAFPLMVQHLLPAGLRGIVVAGLLSALMGSLAGVFNACSTLFTVDIYEKLRPKATQSELVRMGRMATGVMIVIAMLWIPVVKGAHGLYGYLQSIQGYLAPPIFVVFFFGVFWKRLNAKGCLWAMIIGFIVGMFRMLVDTPITLGLFKSYREGSFFWIVNNINFQYFSILITIISAIVMIVVSYMTEVPDAKQISGLTFATATAEDKAKTRASWGKLEVICSIIVLVCITFAYIYFRG